jgi:phosphoglycerol transferase
MVFFFIPPKFNFDIANSESILFIFGYILPSILTLLILEDLKITAVNLATKVKRWIYYFISIFWLTLILWISRRFENPNLEQFIFHLRYFNQLFEQLDHSLYKSFIKHVLGLSLILSLFFCWAENLTLKSATKPRFSYLNKFALRNLPLFLVIFGAFIALINFQVIQFAITRTNNNFIEKNYVNPAFLDITKSNRSKNLILIYVESLEKSYSDNLIFSRNLLEPLDNLNGFQFDKFSQVSGTGWTIAAMVASQCSVPFKPIDLPNINVHGDLIKNFLPNITCLGDTLKEVGYINVFMGGASSVFSGKGKFLANHGYEQIHGLEEWKMKGYKDNDFSDWGLHDDDLFQEARTQLVFYIKIKNYLT